MSYPETEKGFFGKLANGDYGLAKTYWLYGVLVGAVVSLISKAFTSAGVVLTLMFAHAVYWIPVAIGTWRAANKYQGPKIWAILAKIAIVIGAIMLAVGLLARIGLLYQV